jgi:hypothetical protein
LRGRAVAPDHRRPPPSTVTLLFYDLRIWQRRIHRIGRIRVLDIVQKEAARIPTTRTRRNFALICAHPAHGVYSPSLSRSPASTLRTPTVIPPVLKKNESIPSYVDLFLSAIVPVQARAHGHYTDTRLHGWFDHLASRTSMCVRSRMGSAFKMLIGIRAVVVRLCSEWIVVPDNAVVTEPNKLGLAVVLALHGHQGSNADSRLPARRRRATDEIAPFRNTSQKPSLRLRAYFVQLVSCATLIFPSEICF